MNPLTPSLACSPGLNPRAAAVLASAAALALLVGCGTPATGPAEKKEELGVLRDDLGRVAVLSEGEPPAFVLQEPKSRVHWFGAGLREGFLVGTRVSGRSSEAVPLVLAAVAGAYGLASAHSEEIDEIGQELRTAAGAFDVCSGLTARTAAAARMAAPGAGFVIVRPPAGGDLSLLKAAGFDTALVVTVDAQGLQGSPTANPPMNVYLAASARLIDLDTGDVLSASEAEASGEEVRRFADWICDAGHGLHTGRDDICRQIASQFAAELLYQSTDRRAPLTVAAAR